MGRPFVLVTIAGILLLFQNCSRTVFSDRSQSVTASDVCGTISCDLEPLTEKPAVTTILVALGDKADDQLVVNGASSQLIAESVIRFSSPVRNPKILLVQDYYIGGESLEDTAYIQNLLSRYDVTFMVAPVSGLTADHVQGFDLVWFNNPGVGMNHVTTRETLLTFPGAVVLQGDDLTLGVNFDLQELTGLHHLDNGTNVVCDGVLIGIDNNTGGQYEVTLDRTKIVGADASTLQFYYGNDIDNASIARNDLEVFAWARGAQPSCVDKRPAIVRWKK